jgi:dephospho-CoA kinase
MTLRDSVSNKPVIGLLGAPGSGKSYVAGHLQRLGAAVIDADALARAALDEPAVKETLTQWWGPDIVRPDGSIDRAAVGRRVFDDPDQLARLEALVHPRVNARRSQLRAQHRADPAVTAIVEDCPLLLERQLEGDCDRLVLIDTPRHVRLERVARIRGWDAAELDRREKNQLPLDIKRGRADYVLDGNADAETVETQARQLLDRATSQSA